MPTFRGLLAARWTAPASQRIIGAEVAEAAVLDAFLRFGDFKTLMILTAGSAEREEAVRTYPRDIGTGRVVVRQFDDIPDIFRQDAVDLVHIPYIFSAQIAHGRELFCRRPVPVVGLVHAMASVDQKRLVERNVEMPSHGMDVAICPSRAVRGVLTRIIAVRRRRHARGIGKPIWPPRIRTIPLAVDTDVFRPHDRAALRAANGIGQHEIVILCVGRLDPWTKMDLLPLICAFARLHSRLPRQQIKLLLVGQEGLPGFAEVLALAARAVAVENHVAIWTQVPREEIPAVYGLADIFVSPSDNVQESFGLTPLEAMATSLPVVLSDWNGYRDLVTEGETGHLVKTYSARPGARWIDDAFYRGYRNNLAHLSQTTAIDLDILIARLERLILDRDYREAMGRRARLSVEARFSLPRMVASYAAVWRDACLRAEWVKPQVRSEAALDHRFDYGSLFAAYASYGISMRSRVTLSAAVRMPDEILIQLADQAGVGWRLALDIVARLTAHHGDAPVGALRAARESQTAVAQAVGFLAKHGLVAIAKPTPRVGRSR